MSDAQAAHFDPDDPDLREMIGKALASEMGHKRWNKFLRTPADLRRQAERIYKSLLGTFVALVLVAIVLAVCALHAVVNEDFQAAGPYGTLALVVSGGVGGAYVLMRQQQIRMRRAGWRHA